MIYKVLNTKYLYLKKFSIHQNEKSLLFYTKFNFSGELWMNLSIILILINNYYYKFLSLENFKVVLFSVAIVPLVFVFLMFRNYKILEKRASNVWKVISFGYSLITYFSFFYIILKVKLV